MATCFWRVNDKAQKPKALYVVYKLCRENNPNGKYNTDNIFKNPSFHTEFHHEWDTAPKHIQVF